MHNIFLLVNNMLLSYTDAWMRYGLANLCYYIDSDESLFEAANISKNNGAIDFTITKPDEFIYNTVSLLINLRNKRLVMLKKDEDAIKKLKAEKTKVVSIPRMADKIEEVDGFEICKDTKHYKTSPCCGSAKTGFFLPKDLIENGKSKGKQKGLLIDVIDQMDGKHTKTAKDTCPVCGRTNVRVGETPQYSNPKLSKTYIRQRGYTVSESDTKTCPVCHLISYFAMTAPLVGIVYGKKYDKKAIIYPNTKDDLALSQILRLIQVNLLEPNDLCNIKGIGDKQFNDIAIETYTPKYTLLKLIYQLWNTDKALNMGGKPIYVDWECVEISTGQTYGIDRIYNIPVDREIYTLIQHESAEFSPLNFLAGIRGVSVKYVNEAEYVHNAKEMFSASILAHDLSKFKDSSAYVFKNGLRYYLRKGDSYTAFDDTLKRIILTICKMDGIEMDDENYDNLTHIGWLLGVVGEKSFTTISKFEQAQRPEQLVDAISNLMRRVYLTDPSDLAYNVRDRVSEQKIDAIIRGLSTGRLDTATVRNIALVKAYVTLCRNANKGNSKGE